MSDITGSYLVKRNKINSLEPLLSEWIKLQLGYANGVPGDAAYWYTEIACTSLLSTAAWQAGMYSLIEFQHQKGSKHANNILKKRKWNGRADIYIRNNSNDFYFEAKFGFIDILETSDDSEKLNINIKQKLELATKDAIETWKGLKPADPTSIVIAIVFLGLFIPNTQEIDIENIIKKFNDHMNSRRDFTAAAWCFPDVLRNTKNYSEYYPGTLMVMQVI